jgi:SAM-dependent methyltransferase
MILRSRKIARQFSHVLQQVAAWWRFLVEYRRFKALSRNGPARFAVRWKDRAPCLRDRTDTTDFDRHYVYHLAWALRCLAKLHPAKHVDISSSLHFSCAASVLVPVAFYDYRLPRLALDNLTVGQADLLALPFADGSIDSLSCMHVIEHIGLGRYGDPLDPDGDLKAITELKRVLAPRGSLLFVVPLGQPRLQFNGQRIYSHDQVQAAFRGLSLEEFALIPDNSNTGIIPNATREQADEQRCGCGCYWWKRPS